MDAEKLVEIRLKCLELAAAITSGGESIKALSQELYNWVIDKKG